MVSNFSQILFVFIYIFLDLVNFCSCQSFMNGNLDNSGFSSAVATWYGDPTGAGSGKFLKN